MTGREGALNLNLLIRRSGHIVQDRPSPVAGWADIPELSMCVGRRRAAWLQAWLQSWRLGSGPRPSAFQAGHIPSSYGSCECYALSVGRCRLPLVAAVAVTVAVNSAQTVG